MVNEVSPVFLKASSPIVLRYEPKSNEASDESLKNDFSPMVVTEFAFDGNDTVSSDVHPENASLPMLAEALRLIDSSDEHPLNTAVPEALVYPALP